MILLHAPVTAAYLALTNTISSCLQEKWLEHQVIRNSMRATSLRIDLLMRVVEEACKRRVTAKRSVEEEEAQAQEKDQGVLAQRKEGGRSR
jgi:hypothetical protein